MYTLWPLLTLRALHSFPTVINKRLMLMAVLCVPGLEVGCCLCSSCFLLSCEVSNCYLFFLHYSDTDLFVMLALAALKLNYIVNKPTSHILSPVWSGSGIWTLSYYVLTSSRWDMENTLLTDDRQKEKIWIHEWRNVSHADASIQGHKGWLNLFHCKAFAFASIQLRFWSNM